MAVEPIARSARGAPIAYPALGFAFHLEPLVPEDAKGLTAAFDRILAAIGPSLKWQWSSVHGEVTAFGADAFDLASTLPGQLDDAAAQKIEDPRARAGASAMNAAHYDKLGVACHGGADRNIASPWSVRFFSRVTPNDTPHSSLLRADAMIAATMPLDAELATLEALASAIAGDLRIRWGAAGLAYAAWELDRYGDARAAIYAHARRHPGFDVGQHATYMRDFHDRLRTVSWLTYLGEDLATKIGEKGQLILRAGERPEAGDVNRRQIPFAYREIDKKVRAIRAAEDIHFYAPWSASTTEAWLRRFE